MCTESVKLFIRLFCLKTGHSLGVVLVDALDDEVGESLPLTHAPTVLASFIRRAQTSNTSRGSNTTTLTTRLYTLGYLNSTFYPVTAQVTLLFTLSTTATAKVIASCTVALQCSRVLVTAL